MQTTNNSAVAHLLEGAEFEKVEHLSAPYTFTCDGYCFIRNDESKPYQMLKLRHTAYDLMVPEDTGAFAENGVLKAIGYLTSAPHAYQVGDPRLIGPEERPPQALIGYDHEFGYRIVHGEQNALLLKAVKGLTPEHAEEIAKSALERNRYPYEVLMCVARNEEPLAALYWDGRSATSARLSMATLVKVPLVFSPRTSLDALLYLGGVSAHREQLANTVAFMRTNGLAEHFKRLLCILDVALAGRVELAKRHAAEMYKGFNKA